MSRYSKDAPAHGESRTLLKTSITHQKNEFPQKQTQSIFVEKARLGKNIGARANAECLEDRLGIMVGDGKAAFGRRRSADAANREAYEEYSRHYCSGDGGHAGGRART